MEADYRVVLKREFDAEEGSFLIQLRCGLTWNREAFTRLVLAMEACCRDTQGKETVDRWVAEGFRYLSWFVENWATHPNFPKNEPAEYYVKAFNRLYGLASWLFSGNLPYTPGHEFEPM